MSITSMNHYWPILIQSLPTVSTIIYLLRYLVASSTYLTRYAWLSMDLHVLGDWQGFTKVYLSKNGRRPLLSAARLLCMITHQLKWTASRTLLASSCLWGIPARPCRLTWQHLKVRDTPLSKVLLIVLGSRTIACTRCLVLPGRSWTPACIRKTCSTWALAARPTSWVCHRRLRALGIPGGLIVVVHRSTCPWTTLGEDTARVPTAKFR